MNEYPTAGGEADVIRIEYPQLGPSARDATVLATTRAGMAPQVDTVVVPPGEKAVAVPANTTSVTAQADSPKVVARDRAIPLAVVVGLISLTGGGLAAVLPIDREWLPAIGFVSAAINAGAVYYLRAIGEGDKDQGRAQPV